MVRKQNPAYRLVTFLIAYLLIKMLNVRFCIPFLLLSFLSGCIVTQKNVKNHTLSELNISKLKFLDEYEIPYNTHFQNTWVGGLSGIDYDPKTDHYFIISDERSASSASRFYTAAIDINNYKIDSVRFLSVHLLKKPNNDTFEALKITPEKAADPESIRYNRKTQSLVWSSEGDKLKRNDRMVLQNPWIYEMDLNGTFRDSFLLPANIQMHLSDNGARENATLEGISFSSDFKNLWASMEGPIYEDGPLAIVTYAGAPVRFTKFDVVSKKPISQFGYQLDAVAEKPVPETAFSVNGISESLNIGGDRFLVLERSFSTGKTSCVIKIYLADFSGASNVLNAKSLYQNKNYRPAKKDLLFNLSSLNRYIDNVEGITIGPTLSNGHQSILLIADNNFKVFEKQQVFLFEIIP